MPTKHTSGNFKQKNKPFKGNKNKPTKNFKVEPHSVTKKIKKDFDKNKVERKNKNEQLKQNKAIESEVKIDKQLQLNTAINQSIKQQLSEQLKQAAPPRIVLLLPLNQQANSVSLKEQLSNYIKKVQQLNNNIMQQEPVLQQQNTQTNKLAFTFPYLQFFADPKIFPGLIKENFIFIAGNRSNLDTTLDYCKVADIICPMLSCKDCNPDKINLDPYTQANAFDELGYRALSCIRRQGMPSIVPILQDLEQFQEGKKQKVRKLFQRYFESELGGIEMQANFENDQSLFNLIRKLQNTAIDKLEWREIRSYMLADQVSVLDNQLYITGFLKGSCLNCNQLVHITGYDDFQISKIEILKNPYKIKHKSKKKQQTQTVSQQQNKIQEEPASTIQNEQNSEILMTQVPDQSKLESLESLAKSKKNSNQNQDVNQILNAIEEMEIGEDNEEKKEQKQKPKEQIMEEEKENKGQDEDNSENNDYQDQQSDISYDEAKDNVPNQEEKKHIKDEITQRNPDELEFEDEIDYPQDIFLKDRFSKYQGMKSFKNDEWDQYKNLPEEFEYIYTFKNIQNVRKVAIKAALTEAFAYGGMYVRICVNNFPVQKLQTHNQDYPIILSSLLKHERKTTLIHFKLGINPDFKECNSKQNYDIHLGFRKFNTSLILSKIFPNNKKTKYCKSIKQNYLQPFVGSLYYYCTYSPCPVIIFDNEQNKLMGKFIMSGQLIQNDQSDVIIKRIILTGYPYKINKRKAVVKFLFFNPKDVVYFSPIEVHTKLGLRGKIVESVGTHGLCKITFNQQIKQHDTIMLSLYRRVYPKNLYLNKNNV